MRLQVRLAEEGVVPEEHDEHDEADAPHVDRLVVRLLVAAVAADELGREVVVGAAHRVHLLPRLRDEAAEAEVGDQHVRLARLVGEQDVLGLEVAVDDAALVHVLEPEEDRLDVVLHLLLVVHVALLGDPVHQLAARRELAHEDQRGRALVRVLELHDVLVAQRAQHAELAHHRVVVLLVLLELLVEDLRREEAARLAVAHELHLRKVAAPDGLALLVDLPKAVVVLERRRPLGQGAVLDLGRHLRAAARRVQAKPICVANNDGEDL